MCCNSSLIFQLDLMRKFKFTSPLQQHLLTCIECTHSWKESLLSSMDINIFLILFCSRRCISTQCAHSRTKMIIITCPHPILRNRTLIHLIQLWHVMCSGKAATNTLKRAKFGLTMQFLTAYNAFEWYFCCLYDWLQYLYVLFSKTNEVNIYTNCQASWEDWKLD